MEDSWEGKAYDEYVKRHPNQESNLLAREQAQRDEFNSGRMDIAQRTGIPAKKERNAGYMERMNNMQINGVISEPGFKLNKAKTKEVYSFKFTSGDKWQYIYITDPALQATATRLNGQNVTIEGSESQSGDKTYFNPNAISEAPKQASTSSAHPQEVVSKVIPQNKETDWDMIGRQKARCSILQAAVSFCNGVGEHDANATDAVRVAQQFEAYVFSLVPTTKPSEIATTPTVARKPAPEGMFAGGGTEPAGNAAVMITGQQLYQLRKKVQAKDDNDLLTQAEVFFQHPLNSLQAITFNEADAWINTIAKAQK